MASPDKKLEELIVVYSAKTIDRLAETLQKKKRELQDTLLKEKKKGLELCNKLSQTESMDLSALRALE